MLLLTSGWNSRFLKVIFFDIPVFTIKNLNKILELADLFKGECTFKSMDDFEMKLFFMVFQKALALEEMTPKSPLDSHGSLLTIKLKK